MERVTVRGYWSSVWRRLANLAEARGYFITQYLKGWRYTVAIEIKGKGGKCVVAYLSSWTNKSGETKTRIGIACEGDEGVQREVRELISRL